MKQKVIRAERTDAGRKRGLVFSNGILLLGAFMFIGFSVFSRNTHAAITFKKTKLILGKATITAEVADTEEKRERGLMERTTLKDSEGMIFIFEHPQVQAFWMKDTLIPLSIGYIDASGKLFQTLDMDPASPVELHPKTYLSAKPALYALEVPQGWFVRKKISLGTQMKIPELHVPDR